MGLKQTSGNAIIEMILKKSTGRIWIHKHKHTHTHTHTHNIEKLVYKGTKYNGQNTVRKYSMLKLIIHQFCLIKKRKKWIQKVAGKFLCTWQAIDNIHMIYLFNELSIDATSGTEKTRVALNNFLNYCAKTKKQK